MNTVITLLFLLTAASGTGVALTREPRRQVMAMAANGLVLALLFMALQAPDVAYSELTVGTAALPLIFLVVLAGVDINRARRGRDDSTRHSHDNAARPRLDDAARPRRDGP